MGHVGTFKLKMVLIPRRTTPAQIQLKAHTQSTLDTHAGERVVLYVFRLHGVKTSQVRESTVNRVKFALDDVELIDCTKCFQFNEKTRSNACALASDME